MYIIDLAKRTRISDSEALNTIHKTADTPSSKSKSKKLFKTTISNIISGTIVAIISVLLTHYLTLKQIQYSYNFDIVKYEEGQYTQEELLERALKYYNVEQYLDVINIYNLDTMETNPIALNNLAYMYEKGIFFNVNIEKAKELYFHASQLGCQTATDNFVIISLQNPNNIDELVAALKYGYQNNSIAVYQYMEYFTYEGGKSIDDFFDLYDYEQKDLLIQTSYWVKVDKDEYDNFVNGSQGAYNLTYVTTSIETVTKYIGMEIVSNHETGFCTTTPLTTDVQSYTATYYKRVFANASNFDTTFIKEYM